MKHYQVLRSQFLLLVTPLIASSTFLPSPSQAATFASSQGELNFTNFSEAFSIVGTQNQAETFSFANGGSVTSQNINAVTNSTDEPPSASTSALSQASGDRKDYLGTAKTQAKIVGNFDVDPGKLFSFDFSSALDLQTAIDTPPVENAKASGNISFELFDTTDIPEQSLEDFVSGLLSNTTNSIQKNPLDFFSLTGNLNTLGNDNFIKNQKSQNVTLTSEDPQFSFGGNEEFATDVVNGSLQRSFDRKANLTLVAFRSTEARVTAPEPSTSLALVLFFGLLVVATKGERKITTIEICEKECMNTRRSTRMEGDA